MFSKILQKLESSAFRYAARKGELRCPDCGAANVAPNASPGDMLDCPECGGRSVARTWLSSGGPPRGWADRPPAGTKIQRKSRDDGALMWDIPASGKSGGFLVFGILWCAITAVVSGTLLPAILFGEPAEEGGSVLRMVVVPAMILFFGVFWAIGLGMLYAAARNKWARTRVVVTGDEVILGRRLFGHVMEKRVPRSEITDVKTEEFYQSNDVPVHGVAIHAGKRKLKFGSMLGDDEKGWLAADLRRELLGEAVHKAAAAQRAESSGTPSTRSFSLPIPNAGKHLRPLAIVLILMGIAFMAGGFFLSGNAFGGVEKDAPLIVRIFDTVFSFVTSGFFIIWFSISLAMTFVGIWLFAKLYREKSLEHRFEGDASVIAIRKIQHGRILSEETFARSEFSGVFTSRSGESNGKPMNRIDLQLRSQSKTLAPWVDADAAERFAAEANGFLRDR